MAYRIVVDAGHGGNDPGAVNGNLKEKDFNLEAANYMYERFNELGIPVKITRTTDENLSRTERINRIVTAFGNDPEVILLSNHINAGGGEGAEVVYALRNTDTLAKNVLNAIGDKGQLKRSFYQRRLPENPSKDYYYIMRETGNVSPLLIEYGFIDNERDVNKLKNNLEEYVEAVVKAVTEYTGYTYIGPYEENKDEYIVKKGDSLYSIAENYGITVNELKSYNNLNSNMLQIGQILKIPIEDIQTDDKYINYTVKNGDTLYKIANEYNTTVREIININNLDSTILNVGKIIKVPSNISNPDNLYYTVKSGDSLYSIAKKFDVKIDDIISENNLNTTSLQIGKILIIPQKENNLVQQPDNTIKYIVKNGDTLYKLSNIYNVSVDKIKEINNLNSNALSINQVLFIPYENNLNEPYIEYIVEPGDTLYRIAQINNTSIDAIKNLNNLISNTLQINQVLLIPRNNGL